MTVPIPELPDNCWGTLDTSACPDWGSYDPGVRDRATALATQTLRMLTGYQVGGCPITVRPQGRNACWEPSVDAYGVWRNSGSTPTTEVLLAAPVGRVDEVLVDGIMLPVTSYRLDGVILVRTDGQAWPAVQDFTKDLTEEGTWGITYLNAYEVDGLGAYMAGVLACEFGKTLSGSKACRLPDGVTSIARQGVTYDITPGAFPDGKTGIREVDAYIERYNPGGYQQGPRVYVPGMPRLSQ